MAVYSSRRRPFFECSPTIVHVPMLQECVIRQLISDKYRQCLCWKMAARFCALATLLATFTLFTCVLADSDVFSERSTNFINCGGPAGNGSIGDAGLFKGRVPDYCSIERSASNPLYWKRAWRESLKSHRYGLLGNLEYSIPAVGA